MRPMERVAWKTWLSIALVSLLAFGFRYYYVTHAQVFQPVNQANVRADAADYYRYAHNLARFDVFSKSPDGISPPPKDSFRDPGYPLFEAGWLKVLTQWDDWYAAMLLSQALLGALTVTLTLCLARRWMPLPWLVAAGIAMALWPHSVAITSYLLSETLFGFLCALSLLVLSKALANRSAGWMFASGLTFSLAALTNAVLLPFAPLLALYMLARRQLNLTLFGCMIGGAMLLTVPWGIRNACLPSANASSSERALDNLVQGSWPSYHAAYQASMKGDPSGLDIMHAIDVEIAVTQANYFKGIALIWHRMRQQPLNYVHWYLSKPVLLWGWNIRIGQGDIYIYPTRNSPFIVNTAWRAVAALSRALNPWLFVLTIAGCALATLPRQKASAGLRTTALLLMFVTLVYSTLQAEPRYSIPFRGLEMVLATFAIYQASIGLAPLMSSAKAVAEDV